MQPVLYPVADAFALKQWSRLLSPLSSATTRQDQAKDPAKRLHRFEKEYASLLVSLCISASESCQQQQQQELQRVARLTLETVDMENVLQLVAR